MAATSESGRNYLQGISGSSYNNGINEPRYKTMNQLLDELCGENNWKCFVIHLERAKERKDTILSFAEHIGLSFEFFEAIDKLSLQPTPDSPINAPYLVRLGGIGKDIMVGAIACRMSHHYLMKYFLEKCKEEYILVLEDDAGFIQVPTDGYGKNMEFQNRKNLEIFMTDVKKYIDPSLWNCIQFGFSYEHRRPIQGVQNIDQIIKSDLTHALLFRRYACNYMVGLCEDKRPHIEVKAYDHLMSYASQSGMLTIIGPKQTLIDQVMTGTTSYIWN